MEIAVDDRKGGAFGVSGEPGLYAHCVQRYRCAETHAQETLWIVKNAPLFGTRAGDVYQVIDTGAGTLQNVITFPPDGAFIVDSTISVQSAQRMGFKFSAATLKLRSRNVRLPPVGAGWFESVYCDDVLRVAKDVRGDTLVVLRDGEPRTFS